jgi:hypothetical protein
VGLSKFRILGAGEALLLEIFTPADIELDGVFGTILSNLQVQSPKLWSDGSKRGPWMGIAQLVDAIMCSTCESLATALPLRDSDSCLPAYVHSDHPRCSLVFSGQIHLPVAPPEKFL